MKIGWRDGIATLLFAAVVIPYVGRMVRGSMSFLEDPRGMAVTGLAFGIAATVILGRTAFHGTCGVAAAFFAILAAAVGVVTVIRADEGALSEGLLAVFIGAIAIAWVLAELVHTGLVRPRSGHLARR